MACDAKYGEFNWQIDDGHCSSGWLQSEQGISTGLVELIQRGHAKVPSDKATDRIALNSTVDPDGFIQRIRRGKFNLVTPFTNKYPSANANYSLDCPHFPAIPGGSQVPCQILYWRGHVGVAGNRRGKAVSHIEQIPVAQ